MAGAMETLRQEAVTRIAGGMSVSGTVECLVNAGTPRPIAEQVVSRARRDGLARSAFQQTVDRADLEDIRAALRDAGASDTEAEALAQRAKEAYLAWLDSPEVRAKRARIMSDWNRQVWKNSLAGFLWMTGGFVVSVLSLAVADVYGGLYVTTGGAVVYGAVRALTALSGLNKPPREVREKYEVPEAPCGGADGLPGGFPVHR